MTKPKALQHLVEPAYLRRRRAWPNYLRFASRPDAAAVLAARMKQDTQSGCWEWVGSLNDRGYGVFNPSGTTLFAHRASLLVHRGEFSPDDDVDHLCKNTICINPDHLEPVTHTENVRRGNGGPSPDGKCRSGHDNWRYYPSGRQCDTCNRVRKGRQIA